MVPTPISEKMPKAADEETETCTEEETEDESSTPTLVCTFLRCFFSKFSSSCVGLGGGCHKPRGGGEDKGRQ